MAPRGAVVHSQQSPPLHPESPVPSLFRMLKLLHFFLSHLSTTHLDTVVAPVAGCACGWEASECRSIYGLPVLRPQGACLCSACAELS